MRAHREFPYGLTVKALKEILAEWPEEDGQGEPTTVWIPGDREGLTSEANVVWPIGTSIFLDRDQSIAKRREHEQTIQGNPNLEIYLMYQVHYDDIGWVWDFYQTQYAK